MLQSVHVPQEINDRPEWRHAVRRAGEWVAKVLGEYQQGKHFTWRVVTEAGGDPVFDLLIEAEGAAVTGRFDWFDLNNEAVFADRVLALWGFLTHQMIRSMVVEFRQTQEAWKQEAAVGA